MTELLNNFDQSQADLEITFSCQDGKQLCSRRVLGFSEFFYEKCNKMSNFENALEFKYPDHSHAAIKLRVISALVLLV